MSKIKLALAAIGVILAILTIWVKEIPILVPLLFIGAAELVDAATRP